MIVARRLRRVVEINPNRLLMALMSTSCVPLVCVIGATGTGKTKLSVQLAKHLNGEIISADSIQVYRGLDIASNKATIEEQQGVPHHFLGCLEPGYQLTMPEFRTQSIELISQMHQRKEVNYLNNYLLPLYLTQSIRSGAHCSWWDPLLRRGPNDPLCQ
jgi:tRNA dimethylallyltransferase